MKFAFDVFGRSSRKATRPDGRRRRRRTLKVTPPPRSRDRRFTDLSSGADAAVIIDGHFLRNDEIGNPAALLRAQLSSLAVKLAAASSVTWLETIPDVESLRSPFFLFLMSIG